MPDNQTNRVKCAMCGRMASYINKKTREFLCLKCAQNNEEAKRKK